MKSDPKISQKISSLELFSGAGGLALGLEKVGFDHRALVEWDKDSCQTIRANRERKGWKIFQTDVREFDYSPYAGGIGLIAGGPPCQPFSLGGKHRAYDDERDMFPEAVRAIREVRPRAFIFENVKGLTRASFAKYFNYIILQLTYPEIGKKGGEDWLRHLSKLENYHTKGKNSGLNYRVIFRVLNAADYGVPQRRERVIIVGFRNDLNIEWSFPDPTHSYESLVKHQHEGGYWEKHEIARRLRKSPLLKGDVEQYSFGKKEERLRLRPWRTVRDAIADLPDPRSRSHDSLNHNFVTGARTYAGHTGSHIDLPAKTIKAGDHGVPGGENMLLYPDGKVRYFTVREAARLQTFPDNYAIEGSWTESMRQLGNAVPVILAQAIGKSVKENLLKHARS